MEQARAGHGNDALGVYLNEFPDMGSAFHEGSSRFGVIVGNGSSSLEDKLELAFGGVGVVVKDLSESFFNRLPHGLLYGFDAAEGFFNQLGIVSLEHVLEGLGVDGVFGEPVRDWSLVARDLAFGGDFGSNGGVVTAELGLGFGDLDGGVGSDLEVYGLPWED